MLPGGCYDEELGLCFAGQRALTPEFFGCRWLQVEGAGVQRVRGLGWASGSKVSETSADALTSGSKQDSDRYRCAHSVLTVSVVMQK